MSLVFKSHLNGCANILRLELIKSILDIEFCALTPLVVTSHEVTHTGEIGYTTRYSKIVGGATKDLSLPIVGEYISRPSCRKCLLIRLWPGHL